MRKRIDDERYLIRFSPRKPSSHWSAVNIERVRVLTEAGRMTPAGLAAFARRDEARSRRAAYEQADVAQLTPDEEQAFRAHPAACAYFERQAPSYRKTALWRVVNVKQAATRARRLAALIEASGEGRRW